MDHSTVGSPVHPQLSELAQTHVRRVRDAIQLSHPLSSSFFLQSFPASGSFLMWSQLFTSGVQKKYWSFSFSISISPSHDYSGLNSLRIDWFDLLAVWGTLKSLLQHHSSKASILQCSAFFMVQLSHPYMTTGKITALTRRTFVGKLFIFLFLFFLKIWNASRICVSSLRRGHANLLCIVPILVYVLPKRARQAF